MNSELKEKMDEIREKTSSISLFINRIPEKKKLRFMELAKEEFSNDFGMALSWLVDFRDGLLANPNQELLDRIDVLAQEIVSLHQKIDSKEVPTEQRKVIRAVNGRTILDRGGR